MERERDNYLMDLFQSARFDNDSVAPLLALSAGQGAGGRLPSA